MKIDPAFKTRVHKVGTAWRIDYYLPYSGFLYTECKSWKKAMKEAWKIEHYRRFV